MLIISLYSCKSDDDTMEETIDPIETTAAITVYEADAIDDEIILVSAIFSNKSYLINKEGFPLHKWEFTDNALMAYLSEDGFLYRVAQEPNPPVSFGGQTGRIEKVDLQGNVVWQWSLNDATSVMHHDFTLMPNGNILACVWDQKDALEATLNGRDPNFMIDNAVTPDRIIEIEPVGTNGANIVWQWDVWDHLVQDFDASKNNFGNVAASPERIDINFEGTNGDQNLVHLNSISYIEELDQIVMSSRVFSELWVIDHSTTTAEAAGSTGGTYGKGGDLLYRWGNPVSHDNGTASDRKLFEQHDVTYIANAQNNGGTFLMFNNQITDNTSAVVEVEAPIDANGNYTLNANEIPAPVTYSWIYESDEILSGRTSGAHRMDNGNTLITSNMSSVMREINNQGDILWEYDFNAQMEFEITNAPFKAAVYTRDYPGLDNIDLTPLDPSEY